MIKSRIIRATAVAATSLGLVAGLTNIAGASSGSLNTTGPYSTNTVKSINKAHVDVSNNNHLYLTSNNMQQSASGSANVSGNTNGGSAGSGAAANTSSFGATVSLTNTMPTDMLGGSMAAPSNSGTITNSGPNSDNKVVNVNKLSVNVSNDNNICLTTDNQQSAKSGTANVSGNTNGGSATTGNASNTSTSTVSLTINN
jgi:hypothetical protein